MKRNMDLIRNILLATEAAPPGKVLEEFPTLTVDQETLVEHIWLAEQAGLLDAKFLRPVNSPMEPLVYRLTPAGHDFIEQARHEGLWEKAISFAKTQGTGLSVELLSKLLQRLAAQQLGLS